jgi:hypothetical protein
MQTPYRMSHPARTLALEALHLVSWADGELRPEEVLAADGAALVLGIASTCGGAWHSPPGRAPAPSERRLEGLAARDRRLVLAGGAWVALADGRRVREEVNLLRDLAGAARVDEAAVAELFELARWVRTVAARARSWADEYQYLLRTTDDAFGPPR